jgi:hypothetical protein
MNTVPSGMFEVCMNGAFAVGGTEAATIMNAPDNVGRPMGRAPPPVAEEPPVIVGGAPVAELPVEPPVI